MDMDASDRTVNTVFSSLNARILLRLGNSQFFP
jgi:hypothetical protein